MNLFFTQLVCISLIFKTSSVKSSEGSCSNFRHVECFRYNDCPGYCSNHSRNAGADCDDHMVCKRGKCIYDECIFPTGFCEGDENEACKTEKDCPGICSVESKNSGDPCKMNARCKGKGGVCIFKRCIIERVTSTPSNAPSFVDYPTAYPTDLLTDILTESPTEESVTVIPTATQTNSPTITPTATQTDSPTIAPTATQTNSHTITPTATQTNSPTIAPTTAQTDSPSTPTELPSAAETDIPTELPTSTPSFSYPSTSQPTSSLPPSLEEALLSDKIFGTSSTTCSDYIPENGEYSFTFNLSSLPYFDDSLSDVEEIVFQVQMSHTDSANSNRTWSIKVGTGGQIYSFQGPYGESIPPNTKKGMIFVDEVNQKVCVDSTKNNDANGGGYYIHQSGVYQHGDTGYTDEMPFWFSPNIAIYCSVIIPECRMASWGQQSLPRAWSERVIYYDRYRDCGDGILERTHIMHNAELESTDTILTFTNMPWAGTRYTTLKDFVLSQNPDTWDYNTYDLPGGVEDPMLIFGLDTSYGLDRLIPTTWTLGYTIFAQDLPFHEYPSTPPFSFPGRLPAEVDQPLLVVGYGTSNTNWICQGPLIGFTNPDNGNYRCRFADLGVATSKGCAQCFLRLTNSDGQSFSVFNIRHWLYWEDSLQVYLMYFNSNETISTIQSIVTNGTSITVNWDEVGMSPEENLAVSFVHGTSEQMVENNQYTASRIRYGHSNSVERDFAVFEYISYPNLAFGDSFRARQYYITDQFTGLSSRSEALASDTIEEVIPSGQLEMSQIHLHYINNGQSTAFGSTIDDYPCNNIQTTTLACTGSSTPQISKNPLLQIECGASTYVGTNFYHFSNYPATPYRVMNCTVDGETTSIRPSVKLLGYFSDADCGTTVQNKTFDANFCNN